MRLLDPCGCFPTGKRYPGIAHLLEHRAVGAAIEFSAAGPWNELPVAFIDTETTGRSAITDRLVEIGIVVGQRGKVIRRNDWLIDPKIPIAKEATAVHGISDKDVQGKPTFADIAPELLEALAGAIPAAYNASFDRGFLLAELERAGCLGGKLPPAARRQVDWIDPLVYAREIQQDEQSRKLGDVAARLGIELSRAHRASDDAEAGLKILYALATDTRMPKTYGAIIHEQRRLARKQEEARLAWRKAPGAGAPARGS